MIQFKENARTDGRKDGQTLFYRALSANAGGPINKRRDNISLYSYCNFIKSAYFVYAGFQKKCQIPEKSVIFCYCCFWKLCFIDRDAYFKRQFDFFGTSLFYFPYMSSIDIDTIGNHVHPLYLIVDRNQECIFVYLKSKTVVAKSAWVKLCTKMFL